MTALLLAKLLVAPAFVVAVTLVGRRLGPSAAGMLAAFPVVGGPILGLIVAEQGVVFGARAALAGAVGAATTMLFTLVYTRLASHAGPALTLATSYAFFGLLTALLRFAPITLATAIVVPYATWALVLRAFPVPSTEVGLLAPSRWDLPARALATMALVLAITGVARALGPELAGLITPAPIATAVLAVFTHRQAGPENVAILLRSLTRGLASFTSFFVVNGLLLDVVAPVASFGAALLVALTVQGFVLRFQIAAPHRA